MSGHFNLQNALDDSRLLSSEIILPFVTVIVTNFNYENYIISCLKSVARQKYPYFKCVVVDDCSTDCSVERIEHFIHSDEAKGKFLLIRHENNLGQMEAFKTGLKHSEGVFIVLLDADDLLLEDFLISHVRAHMSFGPVAFTSSNQYQINENNEIIAGTHSDLQTGNKFRYVYPDSIHEPFWIWATTSSMMFRKSVLDIIMPDNGDEFRVCADNYICHFANLIGGSLLIPGIYGCYRRHGSNYFSCNPIVGGRLPTGDMKRHPKHHIVRLHILSHFLKYHEKFLSILSDWKFIMTLLRITGPYELLKIKREYPDYFAKKSFIFFVKLLIMGFIFKIKFMIERYLRIYRNAFYKNKRGYTNV
jgi:glycosyltransferase involved in cell wall biosynthesis